MNANYQWFHGIQHVVFQQGSGLSFFGATLPSVGLISKQHWVMVQLLSNNVTRHHKWPKQGHICLHFSCFGISQSLKDHNMSFLSISTACFHCIFYVFLLTGAPRAATLSKMADAEIWFQTNFTVFNNMWTNLFGGVRVVALQHVNGRKLNVCNLMQAVQFDI